ncbi:MAG: DUF4124 domain-containing protein [Cognaticolwellia sp.]|jgi:hypothetical protein
MKFTFTFVLLLFIFEGHAEIYKWVDENGNAHFTQNINDVPKNIEVTEAKVKITNAVKNTNPVKATIKKDQASSLANKSSEQSEKKKYSPAQLDKKCHQLSKISAMDSNGLNSPEYKEFIKIGCGAVSRMMRKN